VAASLAAEATKPVLRESLDLVPHKGRICLDQLDGKTLAVDTLLLCSDALPDGESWDVVEDELGFACFVDWSGAHDPILAEDLMSRRLWTSASGQLSLEQRPRGASKAAAQWSCWNDKRRHYVEIIVKLTAGPTQANHDWCCYLVSWPRQGMRFFFSGVHLYQHLALTTYCNEGSKWFYNIVPSCEAYVGGLGFAQGHVLKSANANSCSDKNAAFLPKGALSTLAVVALLTRWAFAANKRRGGLGDDTRAPAYALLRGFLCGTMPGLSHWAITVQCVEKWQPSWPLKGQPQGAFISMPVNAALLVDVSQLRVKAQSSGDGSLLKKWWKALATGVNCDTMPLLSMLQVIALKTDCIAMYSQVVWHIARRLEERCFLGLNRGYEEGSSLRIAVISIEDVIEDTRRLCNELAKHVFAGLQHFKPFRNLALTCDKAQVGGLGLQAGAFCSTDGHAALSVIQVGAQPAKTSPLRQKKSFRHRFWCIRKTHTKHTIHQSQGIGVYSKITQNTGNSYTPKNVYTKKMGVCFCGRWQDLLGLVTVGFLPGPQVGKPFYPVDGEGSSGQTLQSFNVRHRAWVKKVVNTSGKLDAWRPRTLHRAASLKFLKAIDNMLRVGPLGTALQPWCPTVRSSGCQRTGGHGHICPCASIKAAMACAQRIA